MQQHTIVHRVPAFDPEHPKWRCCCRACHVETGVLIIGALGILDGLIGMGAAFGSARAEHELLSNVILINGILTMLIYALVIIAQWKRVPAFYCPYLIVEVRYILFDMDLLIDKKAKSTPVLID